MQRAKLNPKQARFLKLYTGQSEMAGNATKCYVEVYGETSTGRVSQSAASRLLGHPRIKAFLEAAEQKALDVLDVNAQYVLDQSIRLYDRAMGDESYPVEVAVTDKETGVESLVVIQRRSYSPSTARQTLEMIGRHKQIQAFEENVTHTHTHYLEQALAARSKQCERRALGNQDTVAGNGNGKLMPDAADPGGLCLPAPAQEVKRGSIQPEVKAENER